MLEELFNLVKEQSGDPVVNNPAIPNELNNDVVAEATNTVAGGLRNMVAGGGLQNIISLFTGGGDNQSSGVKGLLSNPIVNMMIGHFAGKLISKYNIGGSQANNIAANLIPSVISTLINKSNDSSNSGFSLENLLNSITGGQSAQVVQQQQQASGNSSFNFQDLISQFTGAGGGQQGGGSLMDIVSQLAGGAQDQQAKNGSGGLMDLIKGFIK